jgi:uncharacterized membrane protein
MSYRMLDTASGANGGAIKLLDDPGRARNIHVTVLNQDSAAAPGGNHAAFFARSRRELTTAGPFGIPGFCIPVPTSASTTTAPGQAVVVMGGVNTSVVSFLLQGWTGELWAAADATLKILVDVMEGAAPEK